MNSYKALSDDQLLHLLRQDDEHALSILYLRYWDKMLSVACHRLDDPEAAEEIVQDVFFSLWERRADLIVKYSMSTYLSMAVKYRVINLLDHRYRLRNKEQKLQMQMPEVATAEEYIFEKELKGVIDATVQRLPEKCQIVFRLSREEGLSNKEIANQLDIAEKTVEAHISKALRDIRSNLALSAPAFLLMLLERGQLPF